MQTATDPSRLWHNRLGHVSRKNIKKLFKGHESYGLPELIRSKDMTCEECLKCKSTRRIILGSKHCEPQLLDMIVSNVAGPFTPFLSGEKLVVNFGDVATSYSEIAIIKIKAQVLMKLMNVLKRWEKETGVKVKKIRTDRGGEYISGNLDRWLKSEGIQHKFSNPYEPEQNSNAERLNRTLLASSSLPNQFWNFVYLTDAYLHNKIPNSLTGDKTAYELFLGRRPQLNIIRSFGAIAYVHIHKNQRTPGKL